MRVVSRAGLALAILALLAACHRGGRETAPAPEAEPESDEPVQVLIRSFHSQPVRVFLVRGPTQIRLGTVAGGRGQTYTVPRDFYRPGVTVQFVFTLVGGGEQFVSSLITLRPGDSVEWTVGERLKYSTVLIW